MNKKFLTNSILAAGVMSAAVSANAAMGDVKFYAGAGMNYNSYSIKSDYKDDWALFYSGTLKTNGLGYSPILGLKFHDNFGMEVGYDFNKKFRFITPASNNKLLKTAAVPAAGGVPAAAASHYEVAAQTSKSKVNNIYLDLVGFMPVAEQMEIIGGLGISKTTMKTINIAVTDPAPATAANPGRTIDLVNNISKFSKFGMRAKIGAQYNFNSNLSARITAVYQHIGNKKMIKNIKTIGLGVFYTF